MNRITRIALVLAITVLIAGFLACDELASILSVDESSDYPSRELSIGIVLPMSGEYVDGLNDPVMLAMLNGFDLALNEINNTQIGRSRLKFIIEDDRSTEAGAVQAFNKLIHHDGVIAIIAPRDPTKQEKFSLLLTKIGSWQLAQPPLQVASARLVTLLFG